MFLSDDVDSKGSHLRGNSHPDDSNHGEEGVLGSAVTSEESELVKKWSNVMGPSYEIKV